MTPASCENEKLFFSSWKFSGHKTKPEGMYLRQPGAGDTGGGGGMRLGCATCT